MKYAQRLANIKPSATLAINAKTLELKAQGKNIISLALGEPDFQTPQHICEAAKKAIDAGYTKYTAVDGIPEAKAAICEYFDRIYQEKIEKNNVMVSNGGKQSLYNLLLALCSAGDEVLIPAPYWTSYPEMVGLVDGIPVIVQTKAEDGFRLKIASLEQALTPKTRILLLNSPSNPTGVTYTQDELDEIADWAIAKDIFIIADEIYDQLVYTQKPASLIHKWKKHPENIAIENGVSKTFAMTGWRLGYTIAHPQLIKHATTIQGQVTSSICSIAQYALVAALTGSYDCINPMRDAFKRRLNYAYKEISSWNNVICPKAEGAFYLFPDFTKYLEEKNMTGNELCTYILEKAQVALVPGEAFGNPNCLRFSYALADKDLEKALTAIRSVL